MDDIDEQLRAAGQHWRDNLPTPGDTDLSRLPPRSGSSLIRWARVGAVAVLSLVLALATTVMLVGSPMLDVGTQGLASPSPERSAAAPSHGPHALIEDGARVRATGALIQSENGPMELCVPLPQPAVGGAQQPLECPTLRVRVLGLDPRSALTWTQLGDTRFVPRVTLGGIWKDGEILDVAIVQAEEAPEAPNPLPPCEAPSGGWRMNDFGTPTDIGRLNALIEAHPSVFAGVWAWYPEGAPNTDPGPDGPEVYVLPTIDIARAQALTSEIGGNLCLAKVAYSSVELEALATRLRSTEGVGEPIVNPIRNRVRLPIIAFDGPIASRIGADLQMVDLEPLVQLDRP